MGFQEMRKANCLLTTGLAICCLGGCSRPNERVAVHPVHGQVLFDGKPIGGAIVVLHPLEGAANKEVRPLAYTNDEGAFNIATFDANDGAPAGQYVATVEWLVRPQGTDDVPMTIPNKLPPRYGSPTSSKLAVEVVAGVNNLTPFQLTR